AGSVSDPSGVGTEGRWVVFFKEPLVNNLIIGGYADDYVGVSGLAGQADQYMLNAYEDWRMTVAPGRYYVAIVQGEDGYGANPVEVDLSGNGYDIVLVDLVLEYGAGPFPPAPRPSPYAPHIEDIRFGSRLYQATLVARGEDFIISNQPHVSAKAVSPYGVQTSSIVMVLNEGTAGAKDYAIRSSDVSVTAADSSGMATALSFVYDFSAVPETLPEGEQVLTFKASNAYGTGVAVCTVVVAGGEPRLVGVPLTYPSPVHLKTDKEVTFQYTLSHDINVDLFLFDVTGRVVKRYRLDARGEGGSAGVNKVTWDLITDQGQIVSSGIYVFSLVNRDNGKLLGKGKFTCLP
ncbi:hypothetical protein ACFL1W_01430, partial [Candidatus Margulisiibacteriota bacterium]